MIRDFKDFKCTFCGSTKTKKIESDSYNLRKCVCRSVTDRTVRSEDEKHMVYHQTGKEPSHNGITQEELK